MGDILHSEACDAAPRGKKCPACLTLYERDRKRQQRAKKKLDTIQTRLAASKNRSKYYTILCSECKDKTKNEYCSDCKKLYDNTKNKNSRNKKKESNQSKPIELIKLCSGSSCDSNDISNNNPGIHSVTSQDCIKNKNNLINLTQQN